MSINSKKDPWEGWEFAGNLLLSPTGEAFTPTDLNAVYIAWQQNSALKQDRERLQEQLSQARHTRPKCPTSWHRSAAQPPPQLPLFQPQKSPV